MLSVCGVDCTDCKAYGDQCAGCNALEGAAAWVPMIGAEVCPTYGCVRAKGFDSCGQCGERPCRLWLVDTRSPLLDDAAFEGDIKARLKNLAGR